MDTFFASILFPELLPCRDEQSLAIRPALPHTEHAPLNGGRSERNACQRSRNQPSVSPPSCACPSPCPGPCAGRCPGTFCSPLALTCFVDPNHPSTNCHHAAQHDFQLTLQQVQPNHPDGLDSWRPSLYKEDFHDGFRNSFSCLSPSGDHHSSLGHQTYVLQLSKPFPSWVQNMH